MTGGYTPNLITSVTAALSALLTIAPAVTHGSDEGTCLVRDIGAHLPEVSVLDATTVGD